MLNDTSRASRPPETRLEIAVLQVLRTHSCATSHEFPPYSLYPSLAPTQQCGQHISIPPSPAPALLLREKLAARGEARHDGRK